MPDKKISAKKAAWGFVIVLLIGYVLGQLQVDPGDFVYYYFSLSGALEGNPTLATFVYYGVDAIFYSLLLLLAYVCATEDWGMPQYIIYLLMVLTVVGVIGNVIITSPALPDYATRVGLWLGFGILCFITLYELHQWLAEHY